MPCLKIRTNQTIDSTLEALLLQDLSALCAKLLSKPEKYVMIILEPPCPMFFSGSDAPCAYLELKSIGFKDNAIPNLAAQLPAYLLEKLAIPPDRIYIEFSDAKRHLWGWNAGTFE